jgi:diguanylate cyclase
MHLTLPEFLPAVEGDSLEAMRLGFAESLSGLCLCDPADRIRYANARFRSIFLPTYDGRPTDFMTAIMAGSKTGQGLRIVSATPEDFACESRRRRRALEGSRSFSTDTLDGGWWSVTETRLSNGWILTVSQDIAGLKHEEAKLRDAHDTALAEARTDYLTGAPNRRHGLRRAEALWRATRAAGDPLSIALIDVDHFKAINDIYGHEAGDRALVHLSTCVMRMIGPDDIFSRLGGDEFLILRPRSAGVALHAALSAIVSAMPPVALGDGADCMTLSLSVGVAEARPDDTWAGLMHRADVALYEAKAGGRNRIILEQPELPKQAEAALAIKRDGPEWRAPCPPLHADFAWPSVE